MVLNVFQHWFLAPIQNHLYSLARNGEDKTYPVLFPWQKMFQMQK